jgi:hypothetical protein
MQIDDNMQIDDKWLREIKEKEKDYNEFYKEKPSILKLYFLYVNHFNVAELFKKDTYLFDNANANAMGDNANAMGDNANAMGDNANDYNANAILPKKDLLSIISKHSILNGRKYKLVSLLKYNLDVEPEDVINMTLYKQDGNEYLSCEKEIKDIIFYDTICIFQDINSLFFVYQDVLNIAKSVSNVSVSTSTSTSISSQTSITKTPHNKTHKNVKKIYIDNLHNNHNMHPHHNKTKKHPIHMNVKKNS